MALISRLSNKDTNFCTVLDDYVGLKAGEMTQCSLAFSWSYSDCKPS